MATPRHCEGRSVMLHSSQCLFCKQVIDKYIYYMLRCICDRYKYFIQRGDCNDIFGKKHDKAEKERQEI